MSTHNDADALRVETIDQQYTVVLSANGALCALRYGKPWRSFCGDNLILTLAQDIETLREREQKAQAEVARLTAELALTKANDERQFRILEECKKQLLLSDQSHSLLPERIAILQACSLSEKRAKIERGDMLVEAERERDEARQKVARLREALTAMLGCDWWHGGMGVYDPKEHKRINTMAKTALAASAEVTVGSHSGNFGPLQSLGCEITGIDAARAAGEGQSK